MAPLPQIDPERQGKQPKHCIGYDKHHDGLVCDLHRAHVGPRNVDRDGNDGWQKPHCRLCRHLHI